MADWWKRLLSARLEIRLDDRSGGGAGLVSVRYRSRSWAVGAVAAGAASVALAWWVVFGSASQTGRIVLPLVLVFNASIVAIRHRQRLLLTDQVLGDAAARAATALGRRARDGSWWITGAAAEAIGPDLVRLHTWQTPGSSGYRDPLRERSLLDAARPALRGFMRPTILPATDWDPIVEPDTIESRQPEQLSSDGLAGPTWPVLAPPERDSRQPGTG